jgi:hypothetical protein
VVPPHVNDVKSANSHRVLNASIEFLREKYVEFAHQACQGLLKVRSACLWVLWLHFSSSFQEITSIVGLLQRIERLQKEGITQTQCLEDIARDTAAVESREEALFDRLERCVVLV